MCKNHAFQHFSLVQIEFTIESQRDFVLMPFDAIRPEEEPIDLLVKRFGIGMRRTGKFNHAPTSTTMREVAAAPPNNWPNDTTPLM